MSTLYTRFPINLPSWIVSQTMMLPGRTQYPLCFKALASGISQHGRATEEVAGLLRVPDAPQVTLTMSVMLCHDARDASSACFNCIEIWGRVPPSHRFASLSKTQLPWWLQKPGLHLQRLLSQVASSRSSKCQGKVRQEGLEATSYSMYWKMLECPWQNGFRLLKYANMI